MTNPKRPITPRYASLPLIALLLKLLGIMLLFFGVGAFVAGVILMIQRGSIAPLGLFVGLLLGGLVLCLVLVAFSELIHLLMDIEYHTRRAADAATGEHTGTTPRAQAQVESE